MRHRPLKRHKSHCSVANNELASMQWLPKPMLMVAQTNCRYCVQQAVTSTWQVHDKYMTSTWQVHDKYMTTHLNAKSNLFICKFKCHFEYRMQNVLGYTKKTLKHNINIVIVIFLVLRTSHLNVNCNVLHRIMYLWIKLPFSTISDCITILQQ